jgi:hypothetical protein
MEFEGVGRAAWITGPPSAEHVGLDPELFGCTQHSPVECGEGDAEQGCERQILRVVRLRPAQVVGDPPGLPTESTVATFPDWARLQEPECPASVLIVEQPSPPSDVQRRADLWPKQRWRRGLPSLDHVDPSGCGNHLEDDVRIDDE